MAKFRTNHKPAGGKGGNIARVGIFAVILGGMLWAYNLFTGKNPSLPQNPSNEVIYPGDQPEEEEFYLPASKTGKGQIVQHTYYTLSYNEAHEQADWVAYVLTRERLQKEWVERPDRFESDPMVKTGSAEWYDYKGSGYDRGHLAPAADMAFSAKAINETFLMSNISPQARDFNTGIWKELEELTRDWAKQNKKLYVVTGPVLAEPPKGKIGESGVSIPRSFFKVLLDLSEPDQKGIAFVIPNEVSYEPLYKFAVSIDEAEKKTGLDFFPELMSSELEASMEKSFNLDLWPFSKQKHDLRINNWNKQQ